jgi:hypothetical protein
VGQELGLIDDGVERGKGSRYLDGFGRHVFVHAQEFLLVLFIWDFEEGDAADLGHFALNPVAYDRSSIRRGIGR